MAVVINKIQRCETRSDISGRGRVMLKTSGDAGETRGMRWRREL